MDALEPFFLDQIQNINRGIIKIDQQRNKKMTAIFEKKLPVILMALAVIVFTSGGLLTALDGKWEISLYFIVCLMFCWVIYQKSRKATTWE